MLRTSRVVAMVFLVVLVAGCASAIEPTSDPPAQTSISITEPVPASTTSTTPPTSTSTTSSQPTVDQILESSDAHVMTPEEVAGFELLEQMSDLLDEWRSDALNRWFMYWIDQGDPELAVTFLIDVGHRSCNQITEQRAAGRSAEEVASIMVGAAYAEEDGWEELRLATYMAAPSVLCPEHESFIAEGIAAIEKEIQSE